MYADQRILLLAPAYNEGAKIGRVVERTPWDVVDRFLVVDDCSSDDTAKIARKAGAEVMTFSATRGVGSAIRAGYHYARENNFDVAVVIAGNGKDDPREINRLLDPLCNQRCDFVMGSRFLERNADFGHMPAYRRLATRLHPLLVGLFCGKRITESTNGYRAIRVPVLDDPRIRLDAPWLDRYELEVYLLMRILQLGYRHVEVPVKKVYPRPELGQSKMRPGIDWWRMLRPVFLTGLRLRT
ncbi:MAG: glycosyltransferase family 2 protein [Gammaproteobacteria bacterium]|nr:glycosyltransferase family 2 protein [Gammaproteobacteria bacterium]